MLRAHWSAQVGRGSSEITLPRRLQRCGITLSGTREKNREIGVARVVTWSGRSQLDADVSVTYLTDRPWCCGHKVPIRSPFAGKVGKEAKSSDILDRCKRDEICSWITVQIRFVGN